MLDNGALEEMIPDKLYLLYTPGTSSASADYRVTVLIKGKKNGVDFEKSFLALIRCIRDTSLT